MGPPVGLSEQQFSTLEFVIDETMLDAAAAAHRASLGTDLSSEYGCSEVQVDALASHVACSLAGLACWPQLILDDGGAGEDGDYAPARLQADDGGEGGSSSSEGEGAPPIIVETRSMTSAASSHWSTLVALLAEHPLPVAAGDLVRLTYTAEFARVDQPTSYELCGLHMTRGQGDQTSNQTRSSEL